MKNIYDILYYNNDKEWCDKLEKIIKNRGKKLK